MNKQPTYQNCYRLKPKVHVTTRQFKNETAGFIYCTYPLYVSKTSPNIVKLLQELDGKHTVADLAHSLKWSPASVQKALSELENRQLIELVPHIEQRAVSDSPSYNEMDLPTVSVLVPVYNRPTELQRCLEALLQLDYPSEKLQIIVIDDASTDNTVAVAAQFPVRLLQNKHNLGPAGSRNHGLQEANGELIAFVDSDCMVSPDWLRQIVLLFADHAIAAVGGLTQANLHHKGMETRRKSKILRGINLKLKIGQYEEAKSALTFGEKPLQLRLDSAINYLPTCNLVVRKSDLTIQNGFDAAMRFGEDVDLCWRLLKQGRHILYQPTARIGHDFRTTLAGFFKTRFDYATSEAFLVARHPDKQRTFYLQLMPALVWLAGLTALSIKRAENRERRIEDRGQRTEDRRRKAEGKQAVIWQWVIKAIRPALILTSVSLPMWASIRKWRGLRCWQLPISLKDMLLSEMRTCAVSSYHMGIHLGRYYSLPLALLLIPKKSRLPALFIQLAPILADYYRRKTKLDPFSFTLLQILENGAYQIGLVAGCRKEGHFTALLPKLKIQPFW